MKKRKIEALLITLCLAAMVINASSGTNAYFTYEEKAHNVITSGDIEIDLIEMMEPEEGGELVPFEDQDGVMPGMDISKIVSVKNTGGQPAYIRIKVDKTIILSDGNTEMVDTSLVTYNVNTNHWTEEDGYYYYNQILNPEAETEPLFTEVSFAKEMGNKYQNSTSIIDVKAQATQVANNGANALEALGWPED